MAKKKQESAIYQLKITLRDCKPPIWRRVQVEAKITLGDLHEIVQLAMGWTDTHLHQFIVAGTYYGVRKFEFDVDLEDEHGMRLDQALTMEKAKILYEYDFGDGWEHEILLEKILDVDPGQQYPLCLTGKRACPPEDCGGSWGYEALLEVLSNKNHPDYEEYQENYGDWFDPEQFACELVNAGFHVG